MGRRGAFTLLRPGQRPKPVRTGRLSLGSRAALSPMRHSGGQDHQPLPRLTISRTMSFHDFATAPPVASATVRTCCRPRLVDSIVANGLSSLVCHTSCRDGNRATRVLSKSGSDNSGKVALSGTESPRYHAGKQGGWFRVWASLLKKAAGVSTQARIAVSGPRFIQDFSAMKGIYRPWKLSKTGSGEFFNRQGRYGNRFHNSPGSPWRRSASRG